MIAGRFPPALSYLMFDGRSCERDEALLRALARPER
jgi:hypothetical protein